MIFTIRRRKLAVEMQIFGKPMTDEKRILI